MIWSTNVGSKSRNNTLAQLLDSGNLVLNIHGDERRQVWQSFDYPTNTMLPNMKLGLDRRTGLNRRLTSWKSEDDPGTGNWLYKIDTNGSPQFFLYEGSVPRWRSGPWNGQGWSGVPDFEQGVSSMLVSWTTKTRVSLFGLPSIQEYSPYQN
ncbi:S-locus-specific glycoprotein S6 [Morella rubra]|uniref:S-locus-specific glycoprotein S6 n=1 Tax=Morella rubra TaxID=262757 RepID=A0A6A1UH90_9ROSI|nr:S-locus-specific glycoprotein S6 [Morella rubra]